MIDLTKIVVALIGLLSTILTVLVAPLLKEKLGEKKYNTFLSFVRTGVYAAEQIFSTEQWKEKKQYVLDLLKQNGYAIDDTAVDAAIEAAVRELRIEQGQTYPIVSLTSGEVQG